MKEIHSPVQFQREMNRLRRRGAKIGLVPTLGALHEGHLSLVRKARRENQVVAVTIFVNPLQFGPGEDYRRYPRTRKKDRTLLGREKVDYLFTPMARALYPKGVESFVEVPRLSQGLCGRFRPGHFRGVATVVAKLFTLARPHRAYFGAKDYQQALVVKQLVRDLNFDIEIRILPIVRDRDGLALSSRNRYLAAKERERALAIPRSLGWARAQMRQGRRNLRRLRTGIVRRLREGLDRIDYVEFVHPETLEPIRTVRGRFVVAVAGWVGKTRLIDNVIIRA